jgi:uncharacterized membrane protein YidH (DUF202 family)
MITFPLWFKIVIGISCWFVATGAMRWKSKNGYLRKMIGALSVQKREAYLNAIEILIGRRRKLIRVAPFLYLLVILGVYIEYPQNIFHAIFIAMVLYALLVDDFYFKKSVASSIREDARWCVSDNPDTDTGTVPWFVRETIDEAKPDGQRTGRVASWALMALSATIAVILLSLTILFSFRAGYHDKLDIEVAALIISVVGAFVIFFGTISWCGIRSIIAGRDEIMSSKGWINLAVVLVVLGIICGLMGSWICFILPVSMAIICLMKNKWFMRLFSGI